MFEPYLKKLFGPDYILTSYKLQEDKVFRFGRSLNADVILRDVQFSRNHVTLQYAKDTSQWFITSHSMNEFFLDGKPVKNGDSSLVCNGAVVMFPLDTFKPSIKLQVILEEGSDEMSIKRRKTMGSHNIQEPSCASEYDTTINVAHKNFHDRIREEEMQLEEGFNLKEEEIKTTMKQNRHIIEELLKEKARLEECLAKQRNSLEQKFAREKRELEKKLQSGTPSQKKQLLEKEGSLQKQLEEGRESLEARLQNEMDQLKAMLERKHSEEVILEESRRKLVEELNSERKAFKQRLDEETKNFDKKVELLNEKKSELEQERNSLLKKLESERMELDIRLAEDKDATMRRLEARFQLEREDMQSSVKELQQQLKDARVQLQEKEKDLQDKEHQIRTEFQEEMEAVNVLDEAVTKDSMAKDYFQVMDNELQCSVCAEIFIDPVLLNCSHSFCKSCIQEWKKTHMTCPNCRESITCVMPQRTLQNFIDQAIAVLSDEQKKKREDLIKERAEQSRSTTVAAQPRRNTRRGRSRSRGGARGRRGTTTRGRQSRVREGTSTNSIMPSNPPAPAVQQPPDEIEDDSDWDTSQSSTSLTNEDSSESDDSLEGVRFRGYGRCFSCGRRGHWATDCPYF